MSFFTGILCPIQIWSLSNINILWPASLICLFNSAIIALIMTLWLTTSNKLVIMLVSSIKLGTAVTCLHWIWSPLKTLHYIQVLWENIAYQKMEAAVSMTMDSFVMAMGTCAQLILI